MKRNKNAKARYVRLYADENSESHFEDLEPALVPR